MTKHVSVLVVGGGISGLVCGYALRRAGVDAVVMEVASQAGGLIRSERRDGYLVELGPQSFSGTEPVRELCGELGIADQLMEAPAHAPRYLLLNRELRPMPLSPPAFLASSLFSARTKWSLVRDVFGRTAPPDSDESLADFTRRKFTPELLEKLVGPFVSGIYAGDPEKLSLRAAFPQAYEAERAAGSVIRGMTRLAKAKAQSATADGAGTVKRPRPTLQTFRDGNETLVNAFAAKLGPSLRIETSVAHIRRMEAPAGADSARFVVTAKYGATSEQLTAENIVLATGTDVAAGLLRELSSELSAALAGMEYSPVAVVSLGYAQSAVGRALDGFGFLIPRSSGLRTLGTVWNSALFPERAPTGHMLLTSFLGGATDRDAMALTETELSVLAHRELTPILKLRDAPRFAKVTKYERALPQYNLGQAQLMAKVQTMLVQVPGLFLAGNYLRGPALGACVEQALAVAKAIVRNRKPGREGP